MLVGCGEVGSAIKKIEEQANNTVYVFEKGNHPKVNDYEFCHICIPYSKQFERIVLEYMIINKPKYTIIHSTVPPGTTKNIENSTNMPIVHSFIRGVHPDLHNSIKTFVKYVGGEKKYVDKSIKHLESIGIPCHSLSDAKTSEYAKLLSTTYYSLNIAYAKYCDNLCKKEGLKYEEVYTLPNITYNNGYKKLGKKHVIRPVLYPPKDGIGGHCCIENAIVLHKLNNDKLIKNILKLGKDSDLKFKDNAWLYCEHIVKEKSTSEIAKKFNVNKNIVEYYCKALK